MLTTFNADLNIFYIGGSGGFFLLHNILLNDQHNIAIRDLNIESSFKKDNPDNCTLELWQDDYERLKGVDWPSFSDYQNHKQSLTKKVLNAIHESEKKHGLNAYRSPGYMQYVIDYVILNQWNVKGVNWKSKEVWPNNKCTEQTIFSVDKNKIFFTCNDIDDWLRLPGKKIVLYTDVRSHLRLALYKKSNWFLSKNLNYNYFRKIVSEEIKNAVEFNNIRITNNTARALDYADDCIYLQELINNPEIFNFTSTRHKDLHNKWLNNHPSKLLTKCHIAHHI